MLLHFLGQRSPPVDRTRFSLELPSESRGSRESASEKSSVAVVAACCQAGLGVAGAVGRREGEHQHWFLLLQFVFYLHAAAAAAKSLQSCPTRCDLIDGSPPGSPVPGILQARTLEWVAISFSNA